MIQNKVQSDIFLKIRNKNKNIRIYVKNIQFYNIRNFK